MAQLLNLFGGIPAGYAAPAPGSSWDDLINARNRLGPGNLSDALAPAEHAAYAQQLVNQNPWQAIPMSYMTPGYELAKYFGQPMGLFSGASAPSMQSALAGYGGILRGLFSR